MLEVKFALGDRLSSNHLAGDVSLDSFGDTNLYFKTVSSRLILLLTGVSSTKLV